MFWIKKNHHIPDIERMLKICLISESVSSEKMHYSFLKVLNENLWIQCISWDPVENTKTILVV